LVLWLVNVIYFSCWLASAAPVTYNLGVCYEH
jgi:hypothetical protein